MSRAVRLYSCGVANTTSYVCEASIKLAKDMEDKMETS